MKFLLKTFLLFVLIVAGRFARTSEQQTVTIARKTQPVVGATPFLVHQVSTRTPGIRQVPGTAPAAETAVAMSIE